MPGTSEGPPGPRQLRARPDDPFPAYELAGDELVFHPGELSPALRDTLRLALARLEGLDYRRTAGPIYYLPLLPFLVAFFILFQVVGFDWVFHAVGVAKSWRWYASRTVWILIAGAVVLFTLLFGATIALRGSFREETLVLGFGGVCVPVALPRTSRDLALDFLLEVDREACRTKGLPPERGARELLLAAREGRLGRRASFSYSG